MLFSEKYTKKTFSKEVERIAKQEGEGYIDAVLTLCETEQIEPKIGARYLTKPIREKLASEALSLNLAPKKSKLNLE